MTNKKELEPLTLPIIRTTKQNQPMVRAILTVETYKELTSVVKKTNLSVQQLAGRMIEYALKNIEYIEV